VAYIDPGQTDPSRTVQYQYDQVGNRTAVIDNGMVTPYTTNALNEYTAVGDTQYGYDADGNMTSSTVGSVTTTYTYNTENQLVGIQSPTDTWSYSYDALGNRVGETHNGVATQFVIDPAGLGNVAAEYDASGNLIARYDNGYGLISQTDASGNPGYYTFSAIGNTSEVTGATGNVLDSYSYDPFGVSLFKSETTPNAFQYVGEYGVADDGSGLNFMRARPYIGSEGRFTQEDPSGLLGGLNAYRYAMNAPTEFVDPTGLGGSFEVDPSEPTPNIPLNQRGPTGTPFIVTRPPDSSEFTNWYQGDIPAWPSGLSPYSFIITPDVVRTYFHNDELLKKICKP